MAINEYEQILQSEATAPSNDYESVLFDERSQQTTSLKQSMYVAQNSEPDRKAQVLQLAEKSNLPPEIVERNYDALAKKNSTPQIDYEQMIDKNPGLAKWLENPDNATLAKDDLDNLGQFEDLVKEHSLLSSTFKSFNSGLSTMYSSIAKIPALVYDTAAIPQNALVKAIGRPDLQVKSPDWMMNNPVTQYYDKQAQAFRVPDMDASITDEIVKGNYSKAGRALVAQFAANTPQQAAIIAATLSGYGVPALIGTGLTTAADANKQAQESGVDPLTATGNALAKGTIESAFERIGTFGILKHWEGIIAKEYGKQVSKEVMKDFAKTIAYSVAGEGNEEALTSAAQDLTDYITGVNPDALSGLGTRALDAGLVGGFSGGAMTGPSAIGSGISRSAQAKQANLDRDFFLSLGKSAEASKLRERLPKAKKNFVEQLTKDSPIENVFISTEAVESYFQSKNINPVKALTDMGVAASFNEAKETGGDIKIPLATMVQLVGTEHYQGLANDIKFDPGGKSVNEHAAEKKELQTQAEQVAKETNERPDNKAQESGDLIRQNIAEQLEVAGYDKKTADAYSEIYRDKYVTRAERRGLGENPFELFKQNELEIIQSEAPDSVDGQAYNQGPESIRTGGLNFGVKTEGDVLSLNPLDGVEASGRVTDSGVAGKTFVVENFKTNYKYLGVAGDMISSLEKSASIKGADTIITSTKRLGIDINSPIADLYKQAGFTVSEGQDGDFVLVKKLEEPRVYNQSNNDRPIQDIIPMPESVSITEISGSVPTLSQAKKALKELQKVGSIKNNHTGWDIRLSSEQIGKTIGTLASQGNRFSAANLQSLIENSVYLRTEDDSQGDPEIKAYHKFYAPMTAGGVDYVIKIDVRETKEGQKYYGRFALEKERPTNQASVARQTSPDLLSGEPKAISIDEFLSDVKTLQTSDPFFQGNSAAPRGRIVFKADRKVRIDLFKAKDPSTLIHESGHLWLEELIEDATMSGANEQLKADLNTVLQWMNLNHIDVSQGAHAIKAFIKTELHEKFARAFELYAMEGKSPSAALRRVFVKFKLWLTNLYKSALNLDVEINPEIRQVFDRMVATDAAIETAIRESNFEPIIKNNDGFGFTGKAAEDYQYAIADAKAASQERIAGEVMEAYNREKEAWYKEQKAAITKEVDAEISSQKIYSDIHILQVGVLPDGSEIKIDQKTLIEQYGKDAVAQLPKKIYTAKNKTGIHPNIVAELMGYRSGNDLIATLMETPDKKSVVDREVERRMTELHPDILVNGMLPERAAEVIHNEEYAKVMRLEFEHLAKNIPALKGVIKRVTKRLPSDQDIKAQATKILAAKQVKEVKPDLYLRNETKYGALAGQAVTRGDMDAAYDAQYKRILNFELYRAAKKASDNIEKTFEKFKKISQSDEKLAKSRDIDMVNAARAVLAQFGIGKADRPAASYLEQLKQYDPDAYQNTISLIEAATEGLGQQTLAPIRDQWKEISYDNFITLKDTIDALWDMSKNSKEMEIDGKKISQDEAVAELEAKLSDYSKPGIKVGYNKAATAWDKTKVKLLAAKAALTRVEAWADASDVGDPNGPFKKYIWNPISQVTAIYRLDKSQVLKKYEAILKELGPVKREEISAREIGYTFRDKTELLMAILHSGNESNLEKLLKGRQWGTENPDGSIDQSRWNQFVARAQSEGILSKNDYDVAQKIWDLMEDMKPGAQRAHKKMYGYYFNEITAKEFQTPWGNYRGGYIPAKVDPYTTEDAAIREERDAFEKNNNSFQFPTTGRGFTKSRVQQYAAPLMLEMSMLGGHIDGVLRFTHLEPTVKQVARLVQNKQFRSSLATVDSEVGKELLAPWLQRAAQQKVVLPSDSGFGKVLDAGAAFLRKSVAMQIMTGNITNTAQQFTGLIVAMSKVKPRHIRNGLAAYVADHSGTTDSIMEKSEWMRSNQGTNIYETYQAIDKIITDPSVFQKAQAFASKHTYFLQSAAQNVVNTIVWLGAYNQAIENKLDEKASVLAADAAVRLTQGTNNPEDISRFETGTATSRLFNQFAGYFNMLANLSASEVHKISRDVGLKAGAGRLLYAYLTVLMLPAVMSGLIVKTMAGKGLDEDDDDNYLDDALALFFGSQFSTLTAMVPFVGTTINASLNKFNDSAYDDRVNLSPVVSTIETMAGVPAEVYKAINGDMVNQKRVVKDILMFMGTASSLPIGPIGKPATYLMDVNDGANPTGPVDFARGLVTGKSGEQ